MKTVGGGVGNFNLSSCSTSSFLCDLDKSFTMLCALNFQLHNVKINALTYTFCSNMVS